MTPPSWRWLLIFTSTVILGMIAYALAGWMGWAIFAVTSVYGVIVGQLND